MSSQEIEFQLINVLDSAIFEGVAAITAKNTQAAVFAGTGEFPDGLNISSSISKDSASLIIEAGSSADFTFFDRLYNNLSELGAEFEVAKLFDSSTGSTHFWESSLDLDIEFDEKRIVFLLQGQDDIDEMLEQIDEPERQESVRDNTQLVIISDDENECDPAQLALAKKLNIPIITEEHFWECQAFY